VDSPPADEVNPPPESVAVATFVVREVVAFLFVLVWLLLFAGSLITGSYTLPFWFHCVAVGVLGYALGMNVAELTAARPPSAAERIRARRNARPPE
jgi:hypothetical protein